jgi:hypothetical protein
MKLKRGLVLFFLVFGFVCLSFTAHAFSETKAEAIASINKALESPEISAWVNKKFGSVDTFKKAVEMAPEDTVRQIARTFNDFQQPGGDLETAHEVRSWVALIVLIGLLLLLF